MANGDQIKALLNAYYNNDDARFKTVALQIAASEARAGHALLAREIKDIIESKDRTRAGKTLPPYGLYLVKVEY